MQSEQPIPAEDPRDRSIAGKTMDTSSSRRLPPSIEKSLLPIKKRATSDCSSSGTTTGDDSFVIIPPKKRRVVQDATNAYYGNIAAQTHHQYDTAAAPPKPSLSVDTAEPPLQHKAIRIRSIRRLFSNAPAAACNRAMEEAEPSAAAAARAKKAKKKTIKNNRPRQSARGAELSRLLDELGATAARYVCTKTLHMSDVSRNQNRLLFSCKPEVLAEHPITALLGETEAYFVHEVEHGLRVSAFDGDGREFDMKLRYLVSNGGYRLIGAWGGFVTANELGKAVADGRHVDVELWAFRSPPLNDEDKEQIGDALEGEPDGGKLGLLFLPYVDSGEDVHFAEEDGEYVPPTKRQASAKAAREERKLADRHAVRASRGKKAVPPRLVTYAEIVMDHGLRMAESVKGLFMLKFIQVMSCPRSTA